MAEIRLTRVEKGATKVQAVPIAVTPEGFWCCPTPAALQKSIKAQASVNRTKLSSPPHKSSVHVKQASVSEGKIQSPNRSYSANPDVVRNSAMDEPASNRPVSAEKMLRSKNGSIPRKVSIEFGVSSTNDIKVVLHGKHGFSSVNLSVHRSVLVARSSFFAERLSGQESLEISDIEDVEAFVETVGLMYCKDMKQRLIKQNVQRVLGILKVSEMIGFSCCIRSCLDYLEAVPWVGEDEEESVVSSLSRLDMDVGGVNSVLKRVCSIDCEPPKATLSRIVELVLKSNDERGRREMKSTVLQLLRESSRASDGSVSPGTCYQTIRASCRGCLESLVSHFRKAAEAESMSRHPMDGKDPVANQIALEADNLAWLLEILVQRRAAEEFAITWTGQQELANLHAELPTMKRYHISCITARLFVGIGKGEVLPSKDTRRLLLQTWLQALINDYTWLVHGCRSFDRKVVEEGIGQTILTLPLEDQQSIMISWMGSFLKAGDSCPNLQKAFGVWWRRAFIRPYPDYVHGKGQSSNSECFRQRLC